MCRICIKKKTFIVPMIEKFVWFVEVYSFEGCNALKKRESSRNKRNERKEKKLGIELLMKRIFWKEVNTLFNFGEIFFSICYQICIYLYLFSSMKTFNNFYVWSPIYSDSRKKVNNVYYIIYKLLINLNISILARQLKVMNIRIFHIKLTNIIKNN